MDKNMMFIVGVFVFLIVGVLGVCTWNDQQVRNDKMIRFHLANRATFNQAWCAVHNPTNLVACAVELEERNFQAAKPEKKGIAL